MNKISISVIIPAYNVELYLADAIESVLRQKQPVDEIIVVDDGSTDGTPQVAERFRNVIRYIRQDNAGPASARNRGLAESRSDWVAFLDADDLWLQRRIEVQVRTLARFSEPVMLCSHMVWFTASTEHRPFIQDLNALEELTSQTLLLRNRVFTSTVLAPRKAIEEVGGFNAQFRGPEDYDLWLRLSTRLRVWRTPQILAAYRIRPNSLSHQISNMRTQERQIIDHFRQSYPRVVSRTLAREAQSSTHLRAAIAHVEARQTSAALREGVLSAAIWPFSLSEYSTEQRFIRARLFRRAILNYLRGNPESQPDQPNSQLAERLFVQELSTDGSRRVQPGSYRAGRDLVASVVVPTYNYGRFIREAVDSALAQTVQPVEVIVVDDGSTDDTPQQMAAYTHDPRVRYLRQENRGLSAARNAGIRAARSEFVAFLDADDRWKPEKLERQLACFTSDNIGLVYCGRTTFNESGIISNIPASREDCNRMLERLTVSTVFSPSSAVVHKHCFEECGGFDESLRKVEDREMWIRIAQHYRFSCAEGCLVEFRVHGKALSLQIEGMEEAFRLTLERAFALRPLRHRFLLRCHAYAFMHYDFSWVYHTSRQHGKAIKHLLLSLMCYPIPDFTGNLFQQRFARYRRLARYLLTPNAD